MTSEHRVAKRKWSEGSSPGSDGDRSPSEHGTPRKVRPSPAQGSRPGASSRQDNSLGVLTKKFVGLIQRAEDHCIDLNDAVVVRPTQELSVQKRRIYDITNVLEGIGLIQKTHKNKIQWVGSSDSSEGSFLSESAALTRELESLRQEEDNVEYWIQQLQDSMSQLTKDPQYAESAYFTFEDLRSLKTDAPLETLLAIRAPPGTTLEVQDPDQVPATECERYQLLLTSKTGEITVTMVDESERVVSTNSANMSTTIAEELLGFTNLEVSKRSEGLSDLFP